MQIQRLNGEWAVLLIHNGANSMRVHTCIELHTYVLTGSDPFYTPARKGA